MTNALSLFLWELKKQIEAKLFTTPVRVHCSFNAYDDCLLMWPKANIKIDPLMETYYEITAFNSGGVKCNVAYIKSQYVALHNKANKLQMQSEIKNSQTEKNK